MGGLQSQPAAVDQHAGSRAGATEQAQAVSAGEPPVTSKLVGSGGGGIPRQRSRLWQAPGSTGEVDSLQNALEAWRVLGAGFVWALIVDGLPVTHPVCIQSP